MTTERAPTARGGGPAPKLLAVSFAYPPLAYPRSMQVARLLKYARAPTVLVCADEHGAPRDPTIEPEADELLEACLRVPFEESSSRRLAKRVAYHLSRPLWRRMNVAPDKYTAWRPLAASAVRDYLSSSRFRPDALVTFAQPFTDHLVGLELKRHYGLPWVAHFSDPWVDNPFSNYDRRTRGLNLALERAVVEAADRTVFTSRETVEMVFAKYPEALRQRARVLPQCFDPSLYGAAPDDRAGDEIVIRYVGNFYGTRSPEPLVRALSAVLAENARALDGVRFEVIGRHDPELVSRAGGDQLPEGLFNLRPAVSYRESLLLMAAADGLLVIDAPAEVSVFLPSKLIDYLGAGRPILGLTPPGAAADLIGRLGGHVAHPSDTGAARSALESFLGHVRAERAEGGRVWGAPEVRRRYEADAVAAEFVEIIGEIVGQNETVDNMVLNS
ncbi:MAG: glycosyltransferase [Acidobacteria bacterium]|nr:glycosyltransferase [Acidobacteriota bacterium]